MRKRYELWGLGMEDVWVLHETFTSFESAKDDIPKVAKVWPVYEAFKIIRYDENVILEISRESALNPT